MEKPVVYCDLNTKPLLNLEEAITFLGFGSKDTFQKWREGVKVGNKIVFLKSEKLGKNIVYKREAILNFVEEYSMAKRKR